MICLHLSVFLLGTLAAAQSAIREVVAAGKRDGNFENLKEISILGVAPDNSIWISQYVPQWGFFLPPEKTGRQSKKLPSATIMGKSVEDLVFNTLGDDGKVTRTYIKNGTEEWSERAGGKLVSAPQASYWLFATPDLVGLGWDSAFWEGTLGEKEEELDWTDLGGQFSSDPATILDDYTGIFHVYGIAKENGKLVQKQFYDGVWNKTWETLSDGPFKGGIATTSHPSNGGLSQNNFHLWTLDSKGALLHKKFDGGKYSDWENLGGKFEKTPSAIHMVSDRIDVVGRNPETGEYSHKAYDRGRDIFNPDDKYKWSEKWHDIKGISYTSEPVLVFSEGRRGTPHLYIIGVQKNGTINAQYMDIYLTEPPPIDESIRELWNVNDPYEKEKSAGWDDL